MEVSIPFFSIIIPCFNSAPYIAHLLQSIVDQHLPKHDLEVILSDDCSTEPYDKQVEPFLDKLNIRRVTTDYNCCPGNTRQRGAENAIGEWLCFADHDDEFIPDTLALVKEGIIQNGFKYYVKTTFHEIMRDTREIVQVVSAQKGLSWNHGKFYNRKNLWQAYNIHFVKDLLSHEDVAITAQVNSVMVQNHLPEGALDIHTYNWIKNPQSLSNRQYYWKDETTRPRSFLEVFYQDYLASTGWIYFDKLYAEIAKIQEQEAKGEEVVKDDEYLTYLRDMLFSTIEYAYFYSESFLHEQGPFFIRQNFAAAGSLVYNTLTLLGMSIMDLSNFMHSNRNLWGNIHQTSIIATGEIVLKHGFEDWLELVLWMYYPPEIKQQS